MAKVDDYVTRFTSVLTEHGCDSDQTKQLLAAAPENAAKVARAAFHLRKAFEADRLDSNTIVVQPHTPIPASTPWTGIGTVFGILFICLTGIVFWSQLREAKSVAPPPPSVAVDVEDAVQRAVAASMTQIPKLAQELNEARAEQKDHFARLDRTIENATNRITNAISTSIQSLAPAPRDAYQGPNP